MSKFLYPFLLLAVPMSYPFLSVAQNRLESTGNVGIGTTTPVVKLSIYGTADDSAAISLQSASNSRFYIQQGGALLKIGGTTPGTGAINVLNTGNVGIGTSNPFAPLHVVTASGAAGITAQSTASYSASGGAFLRLYNSGTPSNANQRIGGLLIGSNPASTLMRTGAQIDAYSDSAWTDGVSQPTYLRFLTTPKNGATPAERMRITADGNIQVQQNTQFGAGLSDRFSYDNKFQAHYGMQWTMDSWYATAPTLWMSSYGGMKFFTQSQPRITITVGGNVGIGTDNPKGYRLAVNGDAMFTRVKVKPIASWPDFVFQPGYQLPSLQELEAYINANRHLPNIPSAEEVEKDGLDLGEMDKRLLQKVEELTLYLIELKKENNEMKQQQNKLLERIAELEKSGNQ